MFIRVPGDRSVCREEGFTLVELLITVVIMGIISLSLGSAFTSFLQNTDTTIRRLYESHDAQISATYFAQDVASVGDRDSSDVLLQSVETSGTAQFPTSCGGAGDPTPIVGFAWDDPTSTTASSQVRVVYLIRTVSSERQLHRLVCLGSSTTPSSDTVLVHNVSITAAPTVTCASPTTCAGTGSAVPQSVTLVLSIKNPATTGAAMTITLTGQRRQT